MNIQISGNLSGPTAFFLAGWPDTCDVFRDNIMATLGADYRIVGLTIPGFDDEHPFLQLMREKGLGNAFGGGHTTGSSPSSTSPDSSWLPNVFPFSCFHAEDAAARAATAQRSSLVNKLRISLGQPPFEMLRTTWKGHSFEDLVTMLEIAVDTAMETCNYCPDTIPSAAAAGASPAAGQRQSHGGGGLNAQGAGAKARGAPSPQPEEGLEGVPLHQLPPTYTRPVLIAHDWGCFLAYELLLIRPDFFSRFVALDIGAYVFESTAPQVEKMCELVSRNEKSRRVPFAPNTPSPPRTPAAVMSPNLDQSRLGGSALGAHPSSAGAAEGAAEQSFLASVRPPNNAAELLAMPGEHQSISTPTSSSPLQLQQHATTLSRSSPQETTTSSPVTVVHGVTPGAGAATAAATNSTHFDAVTPSVSNTSQLRNSVSGAATKRSLASQYAIRRKKPTQQTQRADTWKGLAIVVYQWFLIACTVFIPSGLARWLVSCFVSLIHRPTYFYDPQMVSTPTVELLNHTLNAQFFAQHPYALENRAAFELPVLLQVQEGAQSDGRLGDSSFASINLEHPSLMRGKPVPRLLPGWKFLLIPYVEGSPVPVNQAQRINELGSPSTSSAAASLRTHRRHDGHPQHRQLRQQQENTDSGRVRHRRAGGAAAAARASQRPQSSFYDASSSASTSSGAATSTDMSGDDASTSFDPAHGPSGAAGSVKTAGVSTTSASGDGGYTTYSSYAKGASLFEEWHPSGHGALGRGGSTAAASSGELDPYLSVLSIPQPLWVGEDPLALTGARSFQDAHRGDIHNSEEYFLIAPDCDGPPRRSTTTTAAAASATSPSASHMQVVKRKIFYQAVAFPPLKQPGNGSTSSLNADNATSAMTAAGVAAPHTTTAINNNNSNGSDDATSSRSTQSTVLGRLRRSHRKAALRPSVPVLVSPLQGWVYLRYWLGMLLMCVMAFGSWLLGEKRPTPSSATSDNSGTTSGSVNSAGKVYSNVMTTAMTTIYRRLPATPSLAASTTNLPGDGDVVLHPQSYSPLVSQRFFVPLAIPVLYMYGGDKRVMFHADHWCAYVRQYQRSRDGISDVVEVQGGGHWFFAEKKYQKKVADRIAEFLAAEQLAPPGI